MSLARVPDEPTGITDLEIALLLERTERIEETLERIEDNQKQVSSLVTQFIDGIKPTIEEMLPKISAIGESSWFRMITGGKKR